MPLTAQLIDVLVDPDDNEPLVYVEAENVLYNPRSRRRYSIEGNIPVLLVDEAYVVDATEHQRLTSSNVGGVLTGGTRSDAAATQKKESE
jgi:uncharacterized protein